jgi:hypothetical protein
MTKLAFLAASILLSSGLLAAHLPSDARRVDDVQGVVREPSGVGVPAARVELRAGERVLVATQTDGSGAFRLTTASPWTASWRLHVERLGFTAVDIAVPEGLAPLEITLIPAPLPLPGLIVEGRGDLCEARESSTARGLWDRARVLHRDGLDTLGIASYTWMRTDTLGGGAADRSAGMYGSVAGQRASASLLRESWTRRIEREGYAFPLRRSDRFRSYDSWSYPPLEADFASHFISETFGRGYDFHIETEDDYGWTLRFCSRRTNRPYLEGTLTLGPDTLIGRADWEFVTPDPDENSGGWAEFSPSGSDGGAPFLLPIESLTWVTLPDSQVVRKAHWYQEWVMAPGDSVPFLPATLRTSDEERSPTVSAPPSQILESPDSETGSQD